MYSVQCTLCTVYTHQSSPVKQVIQVSFLQCVQYETLIKFLQCVQYETLIKFLQCVQYETLIKCLQCVQYETLIKFLQCLKIEDPSITAGCWIFLQKIADFRAFFCFLRPAFGHRSFGKIFDNK